jgi:DNA invertase Pin-like site-specific DNA recombinase
MDHDLAIYFCGAIATEMESNMESTDQNSLSTVVQKPTISAARLAANRRNITLSSGRPRAQIDWQRVERLARDGAPVKSIAAALHVSRWTLRRRIAERRQGEAMWD